MPLKKIFSKEKNNCQVTFHVGKEQCLNVSRINIVGDFNSWSSTETPLEKQKDGSFSVTLDFPMDREFQFRYLMDGQRWENDLCADKYCPAMLGTVDNSVLVTKSS